MDMALFADLVTNCVSGNLEILPEAFQTPVCSDGCKDLCFPVWVPELLWPRSSGLMYKFSGLLGSRPSLNLTEPLANSAIQVLFPCLAGHKEQIHGIPVLGIRFLIQVGY